MALILKRWLLLDPTDPEAITAESIPTTSGSTISEQLPLVQVSSTDVASGYLADKIKSGANVTFTTETDANGSENLLVSVNTIPESAIADGSLLARVADAETITGAWNFTNTLTIADLVVNGTTVTTNATTVTVDDPVITLGGDLAPTVNDAKDRGIEFRYHDGVTAKIGFYGYDNSTGKFSFLKAATNTNEVFVGTKAEIDANLDWDNLLNVPNLTGSTSQDFSIQNLTISQDIVPTTNGVQDIGSVTNRFRTIYVNEAKLSTNTLYIGDTPILGTSAQTIQIHADPDQSISIMTSGTGTTNLQSVKGVTVATSGMNADVFLNATGSGSNVRIGATNELQITASAVAISAPVTATTLTTTGNLTVGGNLTVNGTQTTVNSTIVQVRDNIVVYNAGEVGSGVTSGKAGIQIDRGDLSDYQIVFDEADDMFKVGVIGSLEIIASQPWVSTNYSAVTHSHTIDNLSNVTTASKLDGQVLSWNAATSHWNNTTLSTNLDGLSDVVLTTPATGNLLRFDGSNWVNSTLTSAGITLAALGGVASTLVGSANGVCPLGSNSQIPSQYLPSFVDDVVEVATFSALSATGEAGKIYVTLNDNGIYRWSGSTYIKINTSVGSSDTAVTLATSRSISTTGDASWTVNFDGSANVTAALTLANSGVTAGTFTKVTVDAKGRVTVGANLVQADVTNVLGAGSITNTMLANSAVANLSGTNTGDQTITLTGDLTGTGTGSFATTLANSGVTAGSYNNVTVDAKGRVTAGNKNVILDHGTVTSTTLTTTTTAANQVAVTSLAAATRTLKVTAQVTSGSSYQVSELLVIHDGTTASIVEYGNVASGATLASFDADINSGNLRVITTPVNAATTYKFIVTTVNV